MIRMVLHLLRICSEPEPYIGCLTNDEIDKEDHVSRLR